MSKQLKSNALLLIQLGVILTILLFLFSSPPIRLKPNDYKPSPITNPETAGFLLAEYQKAVGEINMRISYQDTWFHYKFLLVGTVAGVFLASMGIGIERRKDVKAIDASRALKTVMESRITLLGAAIACILAVVIDVHIRNDTLVANQLGSWLATYIEPTFLKSDPSLANNISLSWENFLRSGPGGNTGMHLDELYSFTFWPHLHGLTLLLYVFYVLIFRYSSFSSTRGGSGWQWFDKMGFGLVQLSLCAFAWSGHTVPSAFEMKVFPFTDRWLSSWQPPIIFLGCSVLLTIFSYIFIARGSTEESIKVKKSVDTSKSA